MTGLDALIESYQIFVVQTLHRLDLSRQELLRVLGGSLHLGYDLDSHPLSVLLGEANLHLGIVSGANNLTEYDAMLLKNGFLRLRLVVGLYRNDSGWCRWLWLWWPVTEGVDLLLLTTTRVLVSDEILR